jgi:ribokinase
MGGANTDYTVRGPRLPTRHGEVQGNAFLEAPGGKGVNQAVAATRLGAKAALIACVGNDQQAHVILRHLAREAVEAHHVVRDTEATTGATVIQVDWSGHKQTMNAPGANLCLGVPDIRRAGPALRRARVLVVQLEPPLAAIVEAVRIAKAAGVPVVLDAGPARPLPDELLRGVAIVRTNAEEAELLTGVHVSGRPSARRAGRALLARGVGAAVVEAGAWGDLIVWHDGESWLPHLKVRVVDATGAGDAFTAALAVQLAEGRTLAEAGPFASVAAGLATTRLGAQPALPRRDEVLALLERLARRRGDRVALDASTRGAGRQVLPRCGRGGRRSPGARSPRWAHP